MINLLKKYYIYFFLLLGLLPATFFLFRPGMYWNMHDDMQMVRQLEFEKCLKDGQIPCRWVPDLGYGYGYPLFNYYPPGPYLIGQIFRSFQFSFATTVRLTAISQFIAGAIGMYLLSRIFFGQWGGLMSALLFTYAPYHAVNIYVRGAMNEAWASVFFPFTFLFSYLLIQKYTRFSLIALSLSISGLLLSHNPMALIFFPVLGLWCLFWARKIKQLLILLLSAVLGLTTSAFFTLPVIFESHLVQIESMFTNYYHFSLHFVSLFQLYISNFWGDGPSLWGTGDGMSFSIGYLQWFIPFSLSVFFLVKYIRQRYLNQREALIIVLSLVALGYTFLTHERSTFIWQILTPIQKVQFPWRFLNPATFFYSFAAGGIILLAQYISQRYFRLLYIITLSALIITNIGHFTPITSGPISDSQKFSGQAWVNQITGGIYDYLPKTAGTAAKSPAFEYIDKIIPPSTKYTLSGGKHGTDWLLFNIHLDSISTIYLPVLAFPNHRVYLDSQLLAHSIEPELGRIAIIVPAGNHQLYLRLYNTPIRTISNSLTIFSLIFVPCYLLYPYAKSRSSRNKI